MNEHNAALSFFFSIFFQVNAIPYNTWRNETVKLRKWNFWLGKVESASSLFQNPACQLVGFPPTAATDSQFQAFFRKEEHQQKKTENHFFFFSTDLWSFHLADGINLLSKAYARQLWPQLCFPFPGETILSEITTWNLAPSVFFCPFQTHSIGWPQSFTRRKASFWPFFSESYEKLHGHVSLRGETQMFSKCSSQCWNWTHKIDRQIDR